MNYFSRRFASHPKVRTGISGSPRRGLRPVFGWLAVLAILAMPWAPGMIAGAGAETAPQASPASTSAARAVVVMDALSGQVVEAINPDDLIAPASLAKMMTLYLVFDAVREGRATWGDRVLVSRAAWRPEGSKMFLRAGETVTLHDLALGIAVVSGNDASIAAAEHLAGTTGEFANRMNLTAQRLGMAHTRFVTVTGLPAPEQVTTAYDMALLGRALVSDFPESIPLLSAREMTHEKVRQTNRNLLLWRDIGVDGIKTGHTEESGYHMVATAQRDGQRFIVAILGAPGEQVRANLAQSYLQGAFSRYATVDAMSGQGVQVAQSKVWKGAGDSVSGVPREKAFVTVRRDQLDKIQVATTMTDVVAPVAKGQMVGKATISLDGQVVREVDLVADEAVAEGSLPTRLWDTVILTSHDMLDKLF
ncbi:MAG: D-alanyl-D-alanine carboxypeptidase [Nitrospirota bacterium]|nr:D-alanyl-D-alanine carboxypeptidase [Nitrospirota bacterium]